MLTHAYYSRFLLSMIPHASLNIEKRVWNKWERFSSALILDICGVEHLFGFKESWFFLVAHIINCMWTNIRLNIIWAKIKRMANNINVKIIDKKLTKRQPPSNAALMETPTRAGVRIRWRELKARPWPLTAFRYTLLAQFMADFIWLFNARQDQQKHIRRNIKYAAIWVGGHFKVAFLFALQILLGACRVCWRVL